nr:EAL domain-containing protein [Stakelama flava]
MRFSGERVLGSRALPILLAILAGLAVYISGGGAAIERALHEGRDMIRSHSAGDRFVLVEIDAKSLRAINDWPWPRSVHANALEALERAGASTVAFDVDFSSFSSPDEDARFAGAIDSATVPVILSTFRQYASQHSAEEIESLPLPSFRKNAQLAAVNIFPDDDGLVRSYPMAVVTGGVPRPSIGAMLAGAAGRAGQSFPIDTAIDPETIPHISYIDLLNGDIPATLLAGKIVLVGASAIELGDRYPIPGHGVVSGPAIQLIAAETLRTGSSPVSRGPWAAMAVALFALLLAVRARGAWQAAWLISAGLLTLALPLGFEILHWGTVETAPALFMLVVAGTWLGIAHALKAFGSVRGTDQLSGLANRRTLERELEHAKGGNALIALRIGGYADLATLLGPVRGAELVLRLVDRLRGEGIMDVYRIEEGALAFFGPAGPDTPAGDFIGSLAEVLRPPVEIAARRMAADCVFGCATAARGEAAGAVIDHALLAADQAREHGQLWENHSAEMAGSRDWRFSLSGELDAAMAAEHIWVAFQPKLDIAAGRITAAEALVRWTHPERGDIFPDSFIPHLEKNGRMLDLTLYVLDRVMEQARRWSLAGNPINVAVNVSAPLLVMDAFVGAMRERLDGGTLLPSLLTLEITESASMEDPERALAGMRLFAEMGIRLSIDDYGTGQSTLSYLKHFPASEIKIDKSFVLAIRDNRNDQAMVRSTIDLAHELGFAVVAEGVEDAAVLEYLRALGCDYAQGWHIGRPIPAKDFAKLAGIGIVSCNAA